MGFDPISFLLGSKTGGGGGGGSSPWTKLAEQDFTVSTTSTTATAVGTIAVGASGYTDQKMLYVRVRDKAGKRIGYFYGTDIFIPNPTKGTSGIPNRSSIMRGFDAGLGATGVTVTVNSNPCGVYVTALNGTDSEFSVTISSKYSASTTTTIDGTYHVEVYTLEWPDNVSPFA